MELEIDYAGLIKDLILAFFKGVIIALILNWWQSRAADKKLKGEQWFLINHIYQATKEGDYKKLYYFFKLAGDSEKSMIQQILQMELAFQAQTGSFNTKLPDKLLLKNSEYCLSIDLGFQAYVYVNSIKGEEEIRYHWFLKPNNAEGGSNPEALTLFHKYLATHAKVFGIKL